MMMSRPLSSASYIPIRDDATTLSLAERTFLLRTGLRSDGRSHSERRPVSFPQLSRTDDAATAVVLFGAGTRVLCRVTAELVAPEAVRPNDGVVTLSVDRSPMASPSARLAAPAATYTATSSNSGGLDRTQQRVTNTILRTLERCLGGDALDREALCLVPGVLCWKLHVGCVILDDSGNATDATVLAAVAALRHLRLPVVDVGPEGTATIIPVEQKEPLPLPLHYTPFTISFACLERLEEADSKSAAASERSRMLMDPTDREMLCATGHVTWAMNAHAEILALDSSCVLTVPQLRACHNQAAAQISSLAALEAALQTADAAAQSERLRRAQRLSLPLPPLPFADVNEDDAGAVDADMDVAEEEAADEAYRRRALDYAVGHVATAVRDDPAKAQRGAFFASLVQSADRMEEEETTVQLQSEFAPSNLGTANSKNEGGGTR